VIHFLFPSDPLNRKAPDEMFSGQADALARRGFTTSVFADAVLAGTKPLKDIPAGSRVVYRGWMLNAERYAALVEAIERAGATAFTSTQDYLSTHHLPSWYPLLADFTPETRVYPANADITAELRSLGWGAYFLKDYVKSVKSRRGSIVRDPSEAVAMLDELREYRGEIEGGICVRRVEEFVTDSERRYFVLNGIPHSADASPIPAMVEECARRVASKFFSVDVVRRKDGELRIVEVGDGQVSDLVGWSEDAFAAMWVSCVELTPPNPS
jgi:hypothetical protein